MINNNYVPVWYKSPFQHTEYTLARNQIHMDLLFDDMSESDRFMHMCAGAQVDFYGDGAYAIVQIGDTSERSTIEVFGLLLHEAVHVWQRIKKLMGEDNPSSEFEAYSIQCIAQDLFEMYEDSEIDQKQSSIKSSQSI